MLYKKMHIYRLIRSKEIDKRGRPAIFLAHFGDQSLVWCSTTVKKEKAPDIPLVKKLNNKISYFYNFNLEKVSTEALKANWKNNAKNEFYQLNEKEEKILINKLVSFTNQKDPYEKINLLKIENELLKQEKQKLEQQLEFGYEIE